jgi:hypothetical protein
MYLKRNRNIWLLSLLLLIFIFSQRVYSSGGVEETFLGLLYPRTLSMGGTSTALSDDISGLGYNPAGLSLISQKCIGITFGKHLNVNTNILNTGIILPFKKFGSIGFSFERVGIGDLEERNEQGELISTYSDYINKTTLNYSIKPHKLLSLGVRASFDFRTGIEDYSSTNFRTDLGGQIYPLANNYDYSPGPLRFGFIFSNISKKPSLRIGMAYHIYFSSYKYLLITSDLGFLNKNKDLYFGLEIAPIQSFRFRGGLDKFEPTFGFGYDGGNIQFDYSFKYVDFSTTHSFGVIFCLNKI